MYAKATVVLLRQLLPSQDDWGWKGPLETKTPAQAELPRACCPEPRPGGFWMSPDGDFTAPLGNLFQCLTAFTVKCFQMSRWNFTCFNLCPLPHPVSGHCWEEFGSLFVVPFQQVFLYGVLLGKIKMCVF